MLHRVRHTHFLVALALATLSACGSDSSTGPNTQPVTLDQALAELSSPAVASMSAALAAGVPELPALASSRCAFQASTQSFACTPVVASGLTITQSFTLLDGSGGPQSAFDQTTTSAVRANTTVAGTIQDGPDTLTIDGQQQLTLSGLRTATHTLDGTSTMHVVTAGTLGTETTATVTIAGLRLQPQTADGAKPWPLAGKITAQVAESFPGEPTEIIVATATFNGTSKVTVTISIPGAGVTTCILDLASDAPRCG